MKISHIFYLLLLFGSMFLIQSTIDIRKLKKQHKILFTEIENTNQLLDKNQKSIGNLLSNINSIINHININKQILKTLDDEINVLNKQIYDKEIKILQLKKDLQLKKKYYSLAIQKIFWKKNDQNQLCYILLANNITPFFQQILYLKKYSTWEREQGEKIIKQQNIIISEKQTLKQDIQKKENLIKIKTNEEKNLKIQEKTKDNEIKELKKNTKEFQIKINENRKQVEILNRKIIKIINEQLFFPKNIVIRSKIKDKVKKKQDIVTNYVKNKFPFPIEGNYHIISHFGKQQYSNIKNIYWNNNGINIKTTKGNNAKSIFDGVILNIFITNGYQTSIMIKHENYIALYSHIEYIFVKQGEKVKTGQNIGKIYTDKENDNLTILYFELWQERTKLNPEIWLKTNKI